MVTQISNKQELQDFLAKNSVALVDFFATWCGPCKVQAPILEEAESKYSNVGFAKVDVDAASELAQEYGIMSIPTLIVFKHGAEIKRETGVHSLEKIGEMVA
jgi:thioredoxin 1